MTLSLRLIPSRHLWLAAVTVLVLFVTAFGTNVSTQGGAAAPAGGPAAGGAGAAGQARGGGRGVTGGDPGDVAPRSPYLPRSGADEAKGFRLPAGYRMELVASDPDLISPGAIDFDGNGRMYVVELIGYMMDAAATREHDPVSRISRWESTRGDGKFDKHTIFADKLVAPRMVLSLTDGVILTSETDSDDLVKFTDTNGDGVADKREVVFTGIGQSGDANIEHQKAGLVWNMDNWIYTTYNPFRIRWTPTGFQREPTGPNGGQWGLSTDDDGKPWFVDAGGERGPMNFQYPIHYGAFTPCARTGTFGRAVATPSIDPNCPANMDSGYESDFATVWPAPGIADMQGGLTRIRMPAGNLNHFTAATGPVIVRGDRLPADLKGDLLFTEPVGRLIRRAKIDNLDGLTMLRNAYPQAEFLTSEDQLFRPVNMTNAPDGTVFIADLYHGIVQELQFAGPGSYLRAKIEQYQLDKVAAYGRIWRLRYDGRPAVATTDVNQGQAGIAGLQPDFTTPKLYSETPAQLVTRLTHENGWYRDMAQRLLVLKQDRSVVPALQQLARSSSSLVARFHATWTLEGLGALDAGLVRSEMQDPNPRMRIVAIRASETLYKAGDKSLGADYSALTKDADPNVVVQAMLTLNLFKIPTAVDTIKALQTSSSARGVKMIAANLLAPPPAAFGGGGRGNALTPDQQKLMQQGSDVFGAVCFSCHATDGFGQPLAGGQPGQLMAPALAGSPRVQAHRDYIIRVLLNGLTGPLEGKTYSETMVPMGANSDEWVAGIASYVRNSFANSAGLVTAADVARVRAATTRRRTPWTMAEAEAGLPKAIAVDQLTVSASANAAAAGNALTLRGWNSGGPQTAGMWFQVELQQPMTVAEIAFESPAQGGRGGGGGGAGRGGPGGAAPGGPAPAAGTAAGPPGAAGGPAPAPAAAPAGGAAAAQGGAPAGGRGGGAQTPTYPRGYSITASLDGRTWGKPIAVGKGDGGRTTIVLPPTRAKFVRITETDAVTDGAAWAMTNLKIYELPAAAK